MADVAAEIAAKLGLSTAEFKAALADANASVKKFGKGGAEDTDSFGGAVKNLHKGMREFKELMMAGGVFEAVKGFFEMAITAAEKNTDANNVNAEAVRSFSDALKGMHGDVSNMAMNVVGFFNRIGEGVGTALRATKEYFQATVTGHYENMAAFDQAEESERKANEMEHTYAEEKKRYGEEFKRINAEIKSTQEAINAAVAKQLDPEERVAQLQQQRREIEAALASGALNAVEIRQNELALLKNQKDLIDAVAESEKKRRAEAVEGNKQELEIQLKGLSNQQQIALLTDDIASGEAIIAAQKKAGADTTVLEAQQKGYVAALNKAMAEDEAKQLETRRKIAGSVQEELQLLLLEQKIRLGTSTGLDEMNEKLMTQKRALREINDDMEKIAQRSIDQKGELSQKDIDELKTLTKQKEKMEEKIKAQQTSIDLANAEGTAQSKITTQIANQATEKEKLNSLSGYSGTVTNIGDVRTLSDTQLAALVYTQQGKLPQMQQSDMINKSVFDLTNGETIETAMVRMNLAAAQAEQQARSQFRQYVGFFGQQAAEAKYSPNDYQRLSQYLDPNIQKQQATDISKIASTLSSVFPAQARNVR